MACILISFQVWLDVFAEKLKGGWMVLEKFQKLLGAELTRGTAIELDSIKHQNQLQSRICKDKIVSLQHMVISTSKSNELLDSISLQMEKLKDLEESIVVLESLVDELEGYYAEVKEHL